MQHAASISAEEQSIKMAQYAAVTGGPGEGGSEKLLVTHQDYSDINNSKSVCLIF